MDISLSRGPLDKRSGLDNFLATLESVILADVVWERMADNIASLRLNNGAVVGNQFITISYHLQGAINKEQIIKSISWEAKIRLFECSFTIQKTKVLFLLWLF